jgi:ribosomal protein S18 acetylase RimI-like enzyme
MQEGSNQASRITPVIDISRGASDVELGALLREVYVEGGFTAPDVAERLFAGPAVRARGTLVTARDPANAALLGMVILVPPGSAVRQIAGETEAEVHLLAVQPNMRRRGIARALVQAVVAASSNKGYSGLVLSTQESMHAAHAVYESEGFERTPDRDWTRGGRNFLTYRLARI